MNPLKAITEKIPDVTVNELVIHKKLVTRLALLAMVAAFLLATVVYDAVRYGFTVFSAVPVFLLGFTLGITFFARIVGVVWDEEKEAVSIGEMDVIGFGVLVLYYAFDIALRSFLLHAYPDADLFFVRGLIVAGVFGAVLGRLAWFTFEIHKMRTRVL
jgi:hypothetical protein